MAANVWTDTHAQVYRALQNAASQIGARELDTQARAYRGTPGRFQFRVTVEHRAIVDMIAALGRYEVTPERAMALLHTYDIDIARFGARVLTY